MSEPPGKWRVRRWINAHTTLPLLALFFGYAGVMHFVHPEPFVRIVPTWLPAPDLLVKISGAAEIIGGAGVLWPPVRKAASVWLILLLIAVFPANIQMLISAYADSEPTWWIALLWLRLPFQPVMIWWLWRGGIRAQSLRSTVSSISRSSPTA